MSRRQRRAGAVARRWARGSREHYVDAALYDFEYRRRRDDVRFYQRLARTLAGPKGALAGAAGPVIELGCGTGRVAMPLARDGHEVIGLDISEQMLVRSRARIARMRPKVARPRITLLRADLTALPVARADGAAWPGAPLIIAAFNTLMHVYESDVLIALLRAVRARLAPGGRFAFDVLNPDVEWLARDPERRWARTRFTHPETGERTIYTTNHRYDPVSQVALINIYYEPTSGAPGKTVSLAHRQYFPEELLQLVARAGFDTVERYGDFRGKALSAYSESQVLVCGVTER